MIEAVGGIQSRQIGQFGSGSQLELFFDSHPAPRALSDKLRLKGQFTLKSDSYGVSCQLQRYLPSLLFNGTKWHSLFGALKVKEKNLGLHPIQFNIVYYVYIYILLGCHYHEHLVVDEHFLLYCYIFGMRCCICFGNYSVLSNGVQFCEFFFFFHLNCSSMRQ